MSRLAALCWPLLALVLALPALATPSLEQIMADPDWIGPPVEGAWLSLDGAQAYYRVKRTGSPLRELRRINLGTGEDAPVPDEALAELDGAQPVFDRARRQALFLRNGDLFLRELAGGRLRQLSRGLERLSSPRFATDGGVIVRAGDRWLRIDPVTGVASPLADLRFEDEPDALKENDALQQTQLRLFETLRRLRSEREAGRAEDLRQRAADASRGVAPWYLGKDRRASRSEISPDGRWLLLATRPAAATQGEAGKMPRFVTESGYTEVEDVRTRVGRDTPVAERLELLDLHERTRHPIDLEQALPGIKDDPLAALREREGAPKAPDVRGVGLMAAQWSEDGRHVAVQLRSIDNKDRWLISLEPAVDPAAFTVQHRLTDPAWINWDFNDFGWLPGRPALWFLSEESGYSHLYLKGLGERGARALTSGSWEVHDPQPSADGGRFWFLANASHSGEFDLYSLAVPDRALRRLTSQRGVEAFVLSADERQALVTWSEPYIRSQLAVVDLADRQWRSLTDTRTAQYRAIQWPELEIVAVPSRHGQAPVWSKLYRPADREPGRRYPAVLFVHGAGYLQNTHRKFGHYFREQMFHHVLVEQGFVVLDMDFRASAGYGRDWRTAIYRRMGHPELDDLIDGIDWLVAEHQVDPARIGVYGGSYGGFMSLMALFREPDRFVAGAALRPVTDWRHYNHPYTANILNTPDLDPEAHRISSPIEYAEHLRGHLLIAHGMLDDNVFYQDAVLLAQRLIELKKENWELASYPLERHSYVHPESWLDQYRRILKLFRSTLLD